MPHIVIDRIKKIEYPVKIDNIEFQFQAENLIAVKIDNSRFFIKIIKKDNNYLIKYDKITRPLTNYLKQAYRSFIKLNNAKVLFENIEGIKEKVPNKNLLDIDSNLDNINIIEVGFGSGRNLIELAKANPNKIILGIEIHKPSIEQVLKRSEIENINNIKIINHDARLILSKIKSNQLDSIYVHFPVPWDKKPHRRVISYEFIQEAKRTLKINGFLHLRTDSDNYFRYSLNEFLRFNKIDMKVKKNMPYKVSSKYEDRWKKLNKDIYDIFMINEENSEPISNDFNFEFETRLKNLTFKPLIYKNFVIHIEKIYKIDENSELIRLTLGNFTRPEHLYIINKEKPEYFIKPANIKDNYIAHQELKRIFSGSIS